MNSIFDKTGKGFRAIILVIMMTLVSFMPIANITTQVNAAERVTLDDLKAKFPQNWYWNHYVSKKEESSNYARNKGISNLADNSVSQHECWSHSAGGYDAYVGKYDCNRYMGCTQCNGFAKKISQVAYGSVCTSWKTKKLSAGVKPGDVIYETHKNSKGGTTPHWMMVIEVNGNTVKVGECNYGGRCKITWDRTLNIKSLNIQAIYDAPWELPVKPKYYLDLNMNLDGSTSSNLGNAGMADVYINGKLVANDCTDYYQQHPKGTKWEIKDIKAKSGYTYTGKSSYSGTLNGTTSVALQFKKASTPKYYLDLNMNLDGSTSSNLGNAGTADVYINGKLVANDCTDYYQQHPKGTKWEIKDIKAKNGYTYAGKSSYSGTLTSTTSIALSFKKKVESGWGTNFQMKAGAYADAYDGVNGKYIGRVYQNDVITVTYVYNNGWMRMSCPWNNKGNKTIYVKTDGFKFKATKYINAYNGVNGGKVGRVYPNDLLTVKAYYNSSGVTWMKCICPWTGNTNKTIYIKASEIY